MHPKKKHHLNLLSVALLLPACLPFSLFPVKQIILDFAFLPRVQEEGTEQVGGKPMKIQYLGQHLN